jgi:hypothetical protein
MDDVGEWNILKACALTQKWRGLVDSKLKINFIWDSYSIDPNMVEEEGKFVKIRKKSESV